MEGSDIMWRALEYIVNMNTSNYGSKVMIKLNVSLDGIDEDGVNIPPNSKQIVDMVVERYMTDKLLLKIF